MSSRQFPNFANVLETVLHSSNVMMVAMKENSGRQTQFVENSHRGEDIRNFIATILRYNSEMIILETYLDHDEYKIVRFFFRVKNAIIAF